MLLDVSDLTIQYGKNKQPTVQNVSFSLNSGEIMAIVGESGSGKTTVIRAILGCLPASGKVTAGKIIFENRDLLTYSNKDWLNLRGKNISMIFQDSGNMLNQILPIGRQFTEYLRVHDNLTEQEAYFFATEMLTRMNLPNPDNIMKSYPFELSGGMRQRVMIAMMISRNPELLIADEPTTALDVTIEAQILAIIKALKEQFNTAVMLITHNFGLVAEVADKIGVMYAGEMVETGDVFEIFKNPVHPYTRLLMAALPRKTKNEGRLQTIEGNVPRITEKKPGCRFANRCPYATEKCKTEDPPMVMVGEDHMVRCHEIGKEEK